MFGKEKIRKEVKEVRLDTTVQEKKIKPPSDRKLTEKVIERYTRITKKEDIRLIRPDSREIHQLRFTRKPKNMTTLKSNRQGKWGPASDYNALNNKV